jgi:flagellar motor switch protein FliN/FliY
MGSLLGRSISATGIKAKTVKTVDWLVSFGPDPLIARVQFTQGLRGEFFFVLPEVVAREILSLLFGEDPNPEAPLGEAAYGALAEVFGQAMGSGVTPLSQTLRRQLMFSPVRIEHYDGSGSLGNLTDETGAAGISLELGVEGGGGSSLAQIMSIDVAREIIREAGAQPMPGATNGIAPAPSASPAAAEPSRRTNSPPAAKPSNPVALQPAVFAELSSEQVPKETRNIDLILDVSLQLTVELGRARKQIREVLSFGPGSVIELDKLAGEAVDVLVNGKLIAKGEVVVIDENFGVRITDIISPADRVSSLGR